jgi:hypothetical protein
LRVHNFAGKIYDFCEEFAMVRIFLRVAALLLSLPCCILGQVAYDHHVVFDNSLTDGSYYYSEGFVLAPSQLELVDGKIPGVFVQADYRRFAIGAINGQDERQGVSIKTHQIDFAFVARGHLIFRDEDVAQVAEIPVSVGFPADAGAQGGVFFVGDGGRFLQAAAGLPANNAEAEMGEKLHWVAV